ncbi:pyridoxal phosphate-dependent aminotransferase [Candidatus Woesearchaeota archaeon]|nr:pyridoxal phosphate-dependent aminotransferase [Candidatus Woesearchaeota archaeon]
MRDKLAEVCETVMHLTSLGEKLIELHTIDPQIPDKTIITVARDAISPETSGYSSPRGSEGLRTQLAEKYGVGAASVIVSAGSRFLLHGLMQVLLKQGDNIIIPEPEWAHCLIPTISDRGATVRRVQRKSALNWRFDQDELEERIDYCTKGLLLSNPNNPTGIRFNTQEIGYLATFCKERDLYFIVDTAYEPLAFEKSKTKVENDRLVIVGTFSKGFGMAGFRVGYLISNDKDLLDGIEQFIYDTIQCTSQFTQTVARYVLDHEDEMLDRQVSDYKKKLDDVKGILEESSVCFTEPDSAPLLYLHLNGVDADRFSESLLNNCRVAVCPSTAFGTSNQYVRVSLTAAEEDCIAGVKMICEELKGRR